MREKYLVIFEKGPTSFGAMSPEIPGCFAVGQNLEEAKERFIGAAEAHLRWLAESGDPVPHPGITSIDVPTDEPADESVYILERIALSLPTPAHATAA
ncbi:type II toxin-antitoxin system HicB family antitoxin [Terriglobus sp. RCC_193]|uniref:type II toxin-antitoxin system HicB family antitoxin n=1 Tax=Terriglobus sp. RCC_193 TaxID=3239218 RepID=UPI00352392AC